MGSAEEQWEPFAPQPCAPVCSRVLLGAPCPAAVCGFSLAPGRFTESPASGHL